MHGPWRFLETHYAGALIKYHENANVNNCANFGMPAQFNFFFKNALSSKNDDEECGPSRKKDHYVIKGS